MACRDRTVTSACFSDRSTASLAAQGHSHWRAGDNLAGGQPVDRRLWTGHHGVVWVNLSHVF
jgi:hypothetical protein